MSARTLSRCNAFVRVRNKNSACVSQSQSLFLSFSLSASLAVSLFLCRVSVFVASCVACHAPSFSHSLYSLRFPLFLFAFVSLYLRLPFRLHLSLLVFSMRDRPRYTLSLSLRSFADVPSFAVLLSRFPFCSPRPLAISFFPVRLG